MLSPFIVLAIAESATAQKCAQDLAWFGCVLIRHEGLAGGLVGAAVALIAAWIAWSAVREQISAGLADRNHVEALLSKELMDDAEAIGAIWEILEKLEEVGDPDRIEKARLAIVAVSSWVANPNKLSNYRKMTELLIWSKRLNYGHLIDGLETLNKYDEQSRDWGHKDALFAIRELSFAFEVALPEACEFFDGRWNRSPKAMSAGDLLRRIAGVEDK